VRKLKALYPEATVVCYINSTAEVKAESDVCVHLGERLRHRRQPARAPCQSSCPTLMAQNVRSELKRRGVMKEIISSDGTCLVHDEFTVDQIAQARAQFPGLKVVSHPECTAEVAAASDFVGSTGAMMKIRQDDRGSVFPDADGVRTRRTPRSRVSRETFHRGCRLCPYMKLNSLEKIRDALLAPRPEQIVDAR